MKWAKISLPPGESAGEPLTFQINNNKNTKQNYLARGRAQVGLDRSQGIHGKADGSFIDHLKIQEATGRGRDSEPSRPPILL